MKDFEKILNLMGRMGLIYNNPPIRESKFKIDMSPSITQIIEEGVFTSYEAEDIYRILLKHYSIGYVKTFLNEKKEIGIAFDTYRKENGEYGSGEVTVIILTIPNNFKDTEKIKKFFETCGWKNAFTSNSSYENYTDYIFEKNKQVSEIKTPQFLYHLTPTSKVKKILANGLTPHSGNKKSDHLERIYFFQHKPDNIQCKLFVQELWQAGIEKKLFLQSKPYEEVGKFSREEKYSLLEIDITKCSSNIKFYGDPNADGAVWTFDNIPPQAIKVINNDI